MLLKNDGIGESHSHSSWRRKKKRLEGGRGFFFIHEMRRILNLDFD